MTTRIFPLADWGPVQETMYRDSAQAPNVGGTPTPYTSATAPDGAAYESRARSMSLGNLLRRRPKSVVVNADDDFAVAPLAHALPEVRAETSHGWHAPAEKPADTPKLRGIFRRASTSLRAKMHRRPGLNMSVSDVSSSEPRPYTAHATWHRLRQAASFRRPRTPYGAEPNDFPADDNPSQTEDSLAPLPVPSIGGEPPIIPHNTGAAAKASVAMRNEHLFVPAAGPSYQQPASHGFQNKRLAHLPADECGNDRESGIGINVAGSISEADLTESKRASMQGQDANISRVDFVTRLPTELAIQVLSHLDCTALMTACRVSQAWREAVSNQHVWRESFLREKTATYATSGPIVPGAGLGVPEVKPTNDWREIYLAREELDRRWRRGEAKPVYLNGHMDSIYCLQFDEYVLPGGIDRLILRNDCN